MAVTVPEVVILRITPCPSDLWAVVRRLPSFSTVIPNGLSSPVGKTSAWSEARPWPKTDRTQLSDIGTNKQRQIRFLIIALLPNRSDCGRMQPNSFWAGLNEAGRGQPRDVCVSPSRAALILHGATLRWQPACRPVPVGRPGFSAKCVPCRRFGRSAGPQPKLTTMGNVLRMAVLLFGPGFLPHPNNIRVSFPCRPPQRRVAVVVLGIHVDFRFDQ